MIVANHHAVTAISLYTCSAGLYANTTYVMLHMMFASFYFTIREAMG